jgi:hypothetical protein
MMLALFAVLRSHRENTLACAAASCQEYPGVESSYNVERRDNFIKKMLKHGEKLYSILFTTTYLPF